MKKSAYAEASCGLFVFKVWIMVSLSLYHGDLLSAEIMAGLLARDSSSGRLPSLTTSDILPFVLAYSGGSAGEWLHQSGTPLPYRALAGTMIRYSIFKLMIG
jgi:hypothetical protein